MTAASTVLACLAVAALAARVSGRWTWPPVVLALEWAVVFLLHAFLEDEVGSVTTETRFVVLGGIVGFALGASFGRRIALGEPEKASATPGTVSVKRAGWTLAALTLLFAPVWPMIRAIHEQSLAENVVASVNVAVGEGEAAFGAFLWIFRLLLALGIFFVVKYASSRGDLRLRTLLLSSCLVIMVASVAFAARNVLLMVIAGILGSAYFGRLVRGKSLVLAGGGGFAVLFLVVGALRGHFALGADDADLTPVFIVLRNYFVGSVAAFSDGVQAGARAEWGVNTFRSVCLWLSHLGVDVQVKPLVQEMVSIPFLTNVFTAFDPYYKDFGALGVVVLSAITGVVSAYYFARAERNRANSYYVGMAALLYYPLLMSFFEEQYFKQLSNWLFIGAALWTFENLLVVGGQSRVGEPTSGAALSGAEGA